MENGKNETFIDEVKDKNVAMPMYNLTEYSDNYSDTSRGLWQFKRVEVEGDGDLTVDGNQIQNNSYNYKSSLIKNTNSVKIALPLKYLSNFGRSLEMLLINCKVEISLTWDPNCMLCNLFGASTFTITDAKLYVPITTISTQDNVELSKLMREGFKRPVYWNKYEVNQSKTIKMIT